MDPTNPAFYPSNRYQILSEIPADSSFDSVVKPTQNVSSQKNNLNSSSSTYASVASKQYQPDSNIDKAAHAKGKFKTLSKKATDSSSSKEAAVASNALSSRK